MTPEEIKTLGHAFFDGKTLQYRYENGDWMDWTCSYCPGFNEGFKWRIKPDDTAKITKLEAENARLKDQLATAEQRVAEACALQVATETKFHWLDAARVAKEIRSGEWRKFVKEV